MTRSFQLRWVSLAGIVLALSTLSGIQAQPLAGGSLTVDDVVNLAKAGVADDVIVIRIRKNAKAFDLNADEILELRRKGVSDTVIKFLLDPAQPYPPPFSPVAKPDPPAAVAPPPAPAKHYPADNHASRVPPEPGLYRFPGDQPAKIDVRILLGVKSGAGLGKMLMKKDKIIGYLVGPAARTRMQDTSPVFYLRLPEGKAIEEIVLVAFDHKADRREIEMGPAPKQEFKAEALRQFDSLEVGPALFKLTPGKLTRGEYFFFQLGSAEPPKGSYGKGFDFGLDDPHK
jgi:hypothetical protein